MGTEANPQARIGMVNYINTAPILEVWKETRSDNSWQLVEEHPANLNKLLARGEIDLGFVSSYEYGRRPELYKIFADLSISANGPVGSVFLFSHVDPEELTDSKVLLSSQSQTSVCLVKIILEKFYQAKPEYICGNVQEANTLHARAVLAIGDDALRIKQGGEYGFALDLGEVWKHHTGLPFVFAVCAVRESFLQKNQEIAGQIHKQLINCRDEGLADLMRISRKVAPRIPMEVQACHDYLQAIEYDLDQDKILALEKFFTYLQGLGETSKEALPLKIQAI